MDCGSGESIVAYIYDEATPSERRNFEAHLLECAECTDEFAELSNARFSVFEWQKEAFAEIPTPEIVIPYEKTRSGSESGFWEAVKAYLGGFAVPALAAAILLAAGIGFIAIVLTRGDQQLAANTVEPVVNVPQIAVQPSITEVPQVANRPEVASEQRTNSVEREEKNKEIETSPRPSRVATQAKAIKSPTPKPVVARSENRNTQETPRKKPVLSDFEESDDKSLRLTDLFDDIGAGGR